MTLKTHGDYNLIRKQEIKINRKRIIKQNELQRVKINIQYTFYIMKVN